MFHVICFLKLTFSPLYGFLLLKSLFLCSMSSSIVSNIAEHIGGRTCVQPESKQLLKVVIQGKIIQNSLVCVRGACDVCKRAAHKWGETTLTDLNF